MVSRQSLAHPAAVIDSARQLAERLGWLRPVARPTEPPPGKMLRQPPPR
ncbi:hypothetical protein [Nonomuraea sp. LPB2021202275-12-8]